MQPGVHSSSREFTLKRIVLGCDEFFYEIEFLGHRWCGANNDFFGVCFALIRSRCSEKAMLGVELLCPPLLNC
jgi:hypothetical protein